MIRRDIPPTDPRSFKYRAPDTFAARRERIAQHDARRIVVVVLVLCAVLALGLLLILTHPVDHGGQTHNGRHGRQRLEQNAPNVFP